MSNGFTQYISAKDD